MRAVVTGPMVMALDVSGQNEKYVSNVRILPVGFCLWLFTPNGLGCGHPEAPHFSFLVVWEIGPQCCTTRCFSLSSTFKGIRCFYYFIASVLSESQCRLRHPCALADACSHRGAAVRMFSLQCIFSFSHPPLPSSQYLLGFLYCEVIMQVIKYFSIINDVPGT